MVDPDSMVSDPSSSYDDSISTSSCNGEINCEEQLRPTKNKKRRRKITRIIKYVIGFSVVMKNLKIPKKSRKQRTNNLDTNKPPPTTTSTQGNSNPIAANEPPNQPPAASPSTQYNSSSSTPFPSYTISTNSSPCHDSKKVEPNEELAIPASPTKRVIQLVGMHYVMLIISLATLVLYGKVCAILCTILWLILLPMTSRFSSGRRRRWARLGSSNERALAVRKLMARF